jgi:hypothetical protein
VSGKDSSLDGDKMATGNMKAMWALLLSVTVVTALAPRAGAGQFKKPVYYDLGHDAGLNGMVTADFNHDGNLDLAVAEETISQVGILLGKGNGAFRSVQGFSVPSPIALAVADFNGNHTSDLAVIESCGTGSGILGIYLNNGNGTFKNSANYELGAESISLAVSDFNGDGHSDIAVTNRTGYGSDGSVMVFLGNGDGTFRTPTVYKLPGGPFGIAVGDLNGDHHPDLVVTQFDGESVAVFMNTGHGKFKLTNTYPVNFGEPRGPALAGLRHNGILDLVVSAADGIDVYPGNGDGTFGTSTSYSTDGIGQAPTDSVVADFKRDGKPDIAVELFQGQPAMLYGNGDGTFQAAIPIKEKGCCGDSLVAADFDADGAPDLAVVDWSPPGNGEDIVVFLNTR